MSGIQVAENSWWSYVFFYHIWVGQPAVATPVTPRRLPAELLLCIVANGGVHIFPPSFRGFRSGTHQLIYLHHSNYPTIASKLLVAWYLLVGGHDTLTRLMSDLP
jgi:hypothetical protein